ncbi:MAG: PilZ domain-containing protein [Rhizobiaceae bacterium]|nr:PilZ domain-containing protein [Rhizobiaceae bacterium]
MADKRDAKRVKSVFSASLHHDGMFYAHCIIKDVSSTGMKLQLNNKVDLPEEFEVKTPAMTETVLVRRAWTRGNEYGVEFIQTTN